MRLEIEPGLVLDARRTVWLESERSLVVGDLHLGYAWAHRSIGQLMPVDTPDETLSRLSELVDDYRPEQLILLGDILHGATDAKAIREQLRDLTDCIGSRTRLRLVQGNHDGALDRLLRRRKSGPQMEPEVDCGRYRCLHGHALPNGETPADLLLAMKARRGRVLFGHEHPALKLSDGVASRATCPCFVLSDEALILPSFSPWSAGGDIRSGLLSPLAKAMQVRTVVAIVAGKLLTFPAEKL